MTLKPKTETVKISAIKGNPKNPRILKDDKFKKLVQSIQDFPEMAEAREIVVNKDMIVLGGNMRLRAMKEAGWTEVPVKIVDWTQAKQDEFVIKDNASFGEWDWSELANQYEPQELDDWGIDLPKDFLPEPEIEEDEAPEVSSDPPNSELGKVYQLGKHRVMCGDSTDKASVDTLMDGAKADMVFTDPPYGMDLDTDYSKMPSTKAEGNKNYSRVIGDNKDYDPTFILETFGYCNEIVMFGADYYADKLPKGGSWFVWDKRVDEKFDRMIGSAFELYWSKAKHKREIARFNNTLFSGESDARNKAHPTQKPIKLLTWTLERLKGQLVIDLFLGSGSTLIACEQTDRICYGMELDPKYVDVIRKRYHKFVTGEEEGWQDGTPRTV